MQLSREQEIQLLTAVSFQIDRYERLLRRDREANRPLFERSLAALRELRPLLQRASSISLDAADEGRCATSRMQ